MPRQSLIPLAALPLTVCLAACGAHGKHHDDADVAAKQDPAAAAAAANLVGDWQAPCTEYTGDADFIGTQSVMASYTFKDNGVLLVDNSFSDRKCQVALGTSVTVSDYRIGAPVAAIPGAWQIDFIDQKVTFTLQDATKTQIDPCSDTQAKLDKSSTCDGRDFFEIFKVDQKTLAFGDNDATADGSSAAKRPTKLGTPIPRL